MKRRGLVTALFLLLALAMPALASAQNVHFFQCADCHRGGFTMTDLKDGTLCMSCHDPGAPATTLNDSSTASPNGRFVIGDASNAMGSNPAPAQEVSHMWGAYEINPAAGAQFPTTNRAAFDGRYGISRGTVACSRCHNPHGTNTDTTILKLDNSSDQMCTDCHLPWTTSDPDAYETHPIVANYNAIATANPDKFKPVADIPTAPGDVRLVGGKVSCTSCHGVHFTDSDSTTVDGMGQTLNPGDGKLLRSDGPTRTDKSVLCQSCHTYKRHGNPGKGQEDVGCLVCHSGHSYNGGDPSYYVLRDQVTTVTFNSVTNIVYNAVGTLLNDMNDATQTGYCERCHGEAKNITNHETTRWQQDCRDCHGHNVDGATFSWQNDASVAVCGDCHGFPPYRDVAGDRITWPLNDGGYAYKSAAHNYSLVGYYKSEALTPHNAHAAGGTAQAAPAGTDNIFGSGQGACNPCHNGLAAHDEAADPGGYNDMGWNDLATATGNFVPDYTADNCSNIYCHSNGGRRTGDNPTPATRVYNTATIPSWLNGKDTIIGQTAPTHECNFCHGNTAATMAAGDKDNSFSHQAHLGQGPLTKTYTCNVCHNQTASSPTALYNTARVDGAHVNGSVDLSFDTSYSLGSANLTVGGTPYTAAPGSCDVYCHSDGKGATATTPDWDLAATGDCGACHGTTAATLTSGSHVKHIDPAAANIKCDECHGTDAGLGTHTGHIDGAITKLTAAASCDACHGIETVAPDVWDVSPTWGNASTIDCRTCHTGTTQTSYTDASSTTITAPDKDLALSKGHNYNSATPYTVTGNTAAKKACESCHTALAANHVGGAATKLLQGGFACEDCHTAVGSRTGEATVDVQTHSNQDTDYTEKRAPFTKLCTACHDPHGSGNIAMVAASKVGYNAAVVIDRYNSVSLGNGFDELDGGGANNGDDICATCHTTTAHNQPGVTEATKSHNEGKNCLPCHGHDGVNGGFMPTGGDFCNDCHGNPPATGAHAVHTNGLVGSHDESEDKTDCDACHPGAATYTLAHSDSTVQIGAGYNSTFGTCSSACHNSTVADGAWSDANGFNCDACHGNPPAGNNHSKHIAAGLTCVSCHSDDYTAGPGPLTHNDAEDVTTDYNAIATRGTAFVNVSGLDAEVSDAVYNSAVSTWVNGAGATDNTCSNTDCHDPSLAGKVTDWDVSTASCTLCHSDSDPATGSHTVHMNATATFGLSMACADCHVDNGVDTAHRDGSVTFNGSTTYNSINTNCTASVCHQDGKGGNVNSPDWGVASADCTICHLAPPANGRHVKHVANGNYVAGSCGGCHANASDTLYNSVSHIDASVQTGVNITLYNGVTTTCSNSCHVVDSTGTWGDASALDCIECHSGGKIGTAPASGLHQGPLTVSGNTHDDSFNDGNAGTATCDTCHTGTPSSNHIAGGAPNGAEANFDAAVNYNSTFTTCAPGNGLVTCHDDGGAWSRKWSATAKLSDGTECGNCHGDFASGWSAGMGQRHSTDPQLSASHDGIDKCYICHTFKAGDATYYNSVTQHRDSNIQLNDGMSFIDDGDTVHCEGCHTTPLGLADGQYSFQDTYSGDVDAGLNRWGRVLQAGPAADCNGCHDTNLRTHTDANESATVHTYHIGSPLSPGCGACHLDSGPGGVNHDNGTVNFGGPNYNTVADDYSAAGYPNNNCSSVNGCHDSQINSWANDTLAACGDCHAATGKLLDQGGYPPTSNEHTVHLNNNNLVPGDCDDCHGAGSSTGSHGAAHNDAVTTMASQVSSYNSTTGTCSNTCHAVVDGNDWTSGTGLNCADCHSGGGTLDQGAYPPTSAKHTEHIDNNSYVTGDCADCHGLSAATGAHTGHKNAAVENSVTYNSTFQTCSITCHLADTTGDWTVGGALVCRDCHSGTYIGGGGNAPATGLHAITPTVSGTSHDDTLQSGDCVNCHLKTGPSDLHKDGTLHNSVSAAFSFNSATVISYNSAVGCQAAAACHSDGGGWSRQWSTTAANSNGTECGNCHGTFATEFTAGVVARHQTTASGDADGQVAGNHDGTDPCYTCHTYKAGDTTYYNSVTQHRDGSIQVNSQISFVDNGATVGCSACHVANDGTADEQHEFQDATARWTRALQNGPSANCTDCHTSNGRTHGDVSENTTLHDSHSTSGYVSGCADCHSNSGPGNGDHNNGTVNFGGPLMNSALIDYNSAAFGDDCTSANGCHDSDVAGDWSGGSLGADSCADCHGATGKVLDQGGYPPVSAKHTVHIDNDSYVTGDCADCHGLSADTGAHASHQDGTLDNTVTYNSTLATCSNTCHLVVDGRDWTAGTLACADCHSSSGSGKSLDAGGETDLSTSIGPNAGEHDKHMANTAFVGGGCVDCHGHDGPLGVADGHVNGPDVNTITVASSVTLYNTTTATCANACHNVVDGNDWLSATGLNCADCHNSGGTLGQGGYPPTSAKHTAHIDNNAYVTGDCADCHGAGAATGVHGTHKNNAVEDTVTYNSVDQTCSITCHDVVDGRDWTAGTLDCFDCHSGTSLGKANKNNLSGLHNSVSVTRHDESFATGGDCTSCHTGISLATATHVDGTNTDPVADFGLFASYNSTASTCSGAGVATNCHDDGGAWGRLWNTATDAVPSGLPGQAVCNNCHGQFDALTASTGWSEGTVHYLSGIGATENKGDGHTDAGDECEDCHAYDSVANHQNGKITFSGNATAYTLAMGTHGTNPGWYCSSCHDGDAADDALATASHTFPDSNAFPGGGANIEYVTGASEPEGGCTGCHGNSGAGSFWPDASTGHLANDAPGEHAVHVVAIATEMAGGNTLANRNTSCDYCHPNNGHGGDDGVVPADVSQTDSDGNGSADAELATKFKYLIGGSPDDTGFYRSNEADRRCSNVECHASAPYTPGWYGDTVVPGAVSDLTYNAAVLSDPGTVVLQWSAPGDDSGDAGTAYRYDVRSSTAAISAGNFDSATIAGGPPSVDRMGKSQEMVVDGLTPGSDYYFALKTYDETGINVSGISNAIGPATAKADNVVPEFWGLDQAVVSDETGAVELYWEEAKDHSQPVTYKIWYNTATINYNAVPITTQGTTYRVTGLPVGTQYNYSVRAEDSGTNLETNTAVVQAMAVNAPELAWTEKSYYASGVSLPPVNMVATSPGSTNSTALPATFSAQTAYGSDTNVQGNAFAIYIDNGNAGSVVRAELGYWNGAFNSFAPAVTTDVSVGTRAKRVFSFKFNNAGGTVPSGSQLAVQLSLVSGGVDLVQWGDATNRGDLLVKEQTYNNLPSGHSVNQPAGSGIVSISWTAATDADGDPIHYDVYGSEDNGATWPHIIATGVTGTSTTWDTVAAGIGSATCKVKVAAGDGNAKGDGSGDSHVEALSGGWTVDNGTDSIDPGTVSDLAVETRPKQGSVYLRWTAVGDDGTSISNRAAQYDIRFSTSPIPDGATYNSLGVSNQATGEPIPAFSGSKEGFEVLDLQPETTYYFALKVGDEGGNWSAMSNVVFTDAGPKCGVCHSTPPDENATAGNHAKHGYTMADCAACHGPAAATYPMAHQDGELVMGFGGTAYNAVVTGDTVTYYLDGTDSSAMLYQDASSGGFNQSTGGDQIDNGTCYNFSSAGVKCHGPASPSWDVSATLSCADCHGDITRTIDPYFRAYDDTSDDVKASPPVDLQGATGGTVVGQHEKHLNFSFRFSKGDSCRLCHLDNEHGDGTVDVKLDPVGSGASALYNTADIGANGGHTCQGTTDTGCHGTPALDPEWESTVAVACENCHGMGGAIPNHVSDGVAQTCDWCHVEGHPQGTEAGTVLIPNNPAVGINYKSGGIHLKDIINGRGPFTTEAEICWACHDANGISEWGVNNDANTGSMTYDYGSLQGGVSNWVGATWVSAELNFAYKTGLVQSTHTASSAGTSAVTYNALASPPRYEETVDAVVNIRCSNCHDVHDLNQADSDTLAGQPYLRGTWKGNPYQEDGAPWAKDYAVVNAFGAVPRAGTGYTELGGYFIDQNSGNPTAGWTVDNSAGLCVLCHGSNVDAMDQATGESLWLGTNGHSNAAIGGSGASAANIFDYTHGRPAPASPNIGSLDLPGQVANMGYVMIEQISGGITEYGYGYRGVQSGEGYTPDAGSKTRSYQFYNWSATVDDATTDVGYHQFSCSKCHNPHASRLPKLMITNCLDVRHNSWDDAKTLTQDSWTNAALTDKGKFAAYYDSAQNCHRYDDIDGTGGWNTVTPW